MGLVGPRHLEHQRDIGRIEPAAGLDLDAAARRRDRGLERRQPIHRARPLARGQHAVDAAAHQRLDCLSRIASHVEGPMAGDGEGPRLLDERRHQLLVDLAVRCEAAEDDAGDVELAQRPHVLDHRGEFALRIEEIPAARPHNHVERNGRDLQGLLDRAQARRQSALEPRCTSLDAIGAGGLRSDQPVDTLDANFDERLSHGALLAGGLPPRKPRVVVQLAVGACARAAKHERLALAPERQSTSGWRLRQSARQIAPISCVDHHPAERLGLARGGAMALIADDRLFDAEPQARSVARALFARVKDLPLVSPHGHTDPRWYAESAPFPDPAQLLIVPDHYVFRMLYSQGVRLEDLGVPTTGGSAVETDGRTIWRRFAENYHLFRGTPTRLWLDHTLATLFG